MDRSFGQHEIETQEPGSSSTYSQGFKNILKWLTGLTMLTEAELDEAGVYIGNHQDNEKLS
jgi:hypothetical protein